MPDPIDELEGFTMPHATPLPPGEVRRRGDRIRRRNNAVAAVGGLAVIAAIATPFAVLAGHHGSTAPQPAPAPDWTTTIPASFDLTAVPDGSPISFQDDRTFTEDQVICGKVVFSTKSGTDRAGASYHGEASEDSAGRTLAVFADDQQAARVLADYRDGIASCPVDQSSGGAQLEYDVVSGAPASAEDGFVFSEQVDLGGGLYSDLSVYEVARVGNAILVGTTHGSVGGGQQVTAESTRLADLSEPVLSQMCVFSVTGCGTDSEAVDPSVGEGAVPAIPADFPLDDGLPAGGLDGKVPSPEPSSCGTTVEQPEVVETARAQWHSVGEIRDRRLMTFSTEAAAQAYVEAVTEVYCGIDDLGNGATRVTASYGGAPVGDYAAIAVGHNELNGEVDPGLVLTDVVRVGRAVLLAQRVDEGFTWTGDVETQSGQLKAASTDELRPVVDAMCTFSDTGCG